MKQRKAVVLIICLYVLVVFLGLSALAFYRAFSENKISRRNADYVEAFYAAEAGMSYAYSEASQFGFEWYTHEDQNTPVTVSQALADGVSVIYPVPVNLAGAGIDAGSDYYTVAGSNWEVKSYPEERAGAYTGITVILARGTVGGVSRTIEYRLGQQSAYEYFFFYPEDRIFSTAVYDGRNFGGIHVNGNIKLRGTPRFHFLSELSSGWDESIDGQDKGYMYRERHHKYDNRHGTDWYRTSINDLTDLDSYTYLNSNYQYYRGSTWFKTGDIASPDPDKELPWYLTGSGSSYDIDKYNGDGSNTTPAHYQIGNEDLKNLGINEIIRGTGSVSMFSADPADEIEVQKVSATWSFIDDGWFYAEASISLGTHEEDAAFSIAYDAENGSTSGWQEIEEGVWENVCVDWSNFWTGWKANHTDDYQTYHDMGTLIGGQDWERRFMWSAYDWGDSNVDGMPDGLNREWWQDLSYGDDRASLTDDKSIAAIIDHNSGLEADAYYFNSQYQASAWGDWLSASNLDEAGENKTLIEDQTQGGGYIDTGEVIGDQDAKNSKLKQKALNGGIYIGLMGVLDEDINKDGIVDGNDEDMVNAAMGQIGPGLDADVNGDEVVDSSDLDAVEAAGGTIDYEILNPIDQFTEHKQFYNARYTNRDGSNMYEPSDVLKIDIVELSAWIAQNQPEFNGVVYVDLNGVYASLGDSEASKNNGVMLVNGEKLPDGGLSLITPNSVYIKGNYNLDPTGDAEINRDADDADGSDVITRTVANKSYITSEADLEWQPAEVITYRPIYTLSDDFPEPQAMPMPRDHYYQYHDEAKGNTDADLIDHDRWGTDDASWMPQDSGFSRCIVCKGERSRVQSWESLSGQTFEMDKTWINTNWGGWNSNDSTIYSYNTEDGDADTNIYIMRRDLKQAVYRAVYYAYMAEYAYSTSNPANANQLANSVTDKYVYNTAMVTPYDTDTYSLERWGSGSKKTITGAFIKLPNSYREPIPGASYASSNRVNNPSSKEFRYETRFGAGTTSGEKPAADLTFGADSSWREIFTF